MNIISLLANSVDNYSTDMHGILSKSIVLATKYIANTVRIPV